MGTQINKKRYEMDMCNGPLMSKLISFSIPLVLSANLQLLFNAVDIIVVGKFSGSEALAAVGSTTSLIHLIMNLFMGISLGTGVMAGRFYSMQDDKKMDELVHTSITFALISGILVGVIGIFISDWALTLMSTPSDVFDKATLYMKIYFLGMPFFMIYNYGAAILRAIGDTKRPLMFLVIAGIINAVLNMILVIVFHLGVVGVAVATVVSQFISCVLVIRCLCKADGAYKFYFSKMRIKWRCLKRLFEIGLPAGIQSVVMNFSNVLLQSSVNSFGGIAMAGYTAANNIFGFLYATVNSFSQACMSFTSQNYGAKKCDRIDKVIIDCIFLSVGITLVLGSSVYIFAEKLLGIYTQSPEVIQCGIEIFRYTTITYFICGIMDLFPGAMRGMGCSVIPMILSAVGTVGTRIFWIYAIFPLKHSLDFLFISYPLSWVVTVVLQVICFYFVRKKAYKFIKE